MIEDELLDYNTDARIIKIVADEIANKIDV